MPCTKRGGWHLSSSRPKVSDAGMLFLARLPNSSTSLSNHHLAGFLEVMPCSLVRRQLMLYVLRRVELKCPGFALARGLAQNLLGSIARLPPPLDGRLARPRRLWDTATFAHPQQRRVSVVVWPFGQVRLVRSSLYKSCLWGRPPLRVRWPWRARVAARTCWLWTAARLWLLCWSALLSCRALSRRRASSVYFLSSPLRLVFDFLGCRWVW